MVYYKSTIYYCFKENKSYLTYSLCTWTKISTRCNILKYATQQDKMSLPPSTKINFTKKIINASIHTDEDEVYYVIDEYGDIQ